MFLLQEPVITWIKVEKPTFDLVGVVLGSFKLAGFLLVAALAIGVLMGVVLVLVQDGQQIATKDAGGNPPTVTVLEPNGGEVIGEVVAVHQIGLGVVEGPDQPRRAPAPHGGPGDPGVVRQVAVHDIEPLVVQDPPMSTDRCTLGVCPLGGGKAS